MKWKWFTNPDETICEFHRRKPRGEGFYSDKGHPSCPLCQGFRDQHISNSITQKHETGKRCKHANQCSVCSTEKSIALKLKHDGGCCNHKKCQFCKGAAFYYRCDPQDFFSVYNSRAKDIRWLYKNLVK